MRNTLRSLHERSIQADARSVVIDEGGNSQQSAEFIDPGCWDDGGTLETLDDVFILGDYHLMPTSPCIDAGYSPDDGEPILPATDLTGVSRVIDGNLDGTARIDIGAYEYMPGDVNYDGKVNILDLIYIRNHLNKNPVSDPGADRADVNADGKINVVDLVLAREQMRR